MDRGKLLIGFVGPDCNDVQLWLVNYLINLQPICCNIPDVWKCKGEIGKRFLMRSLPMTSIDLNIVRNVGMNIVSRSQMLRRFNLCFKILIMSNFKWFSYSNCPFIYINNIPFRYRISKKVFLDNVFFRFPKTWDPYLHIGRFRFSRKKGPRVPKQGFDVVRDFVPLLRGRVSEKNLGVSTLQAA